MVLLKQTQTANGTEYLFSHYQDAYKKAQRIEKSTGYRQSARHTPEGFAVLEPNSRTSTVPEQQQPMQSSVMPGMPMQQELPTDIGYEFPPRQPPGLYDGKW